MFADVMPKASPRLQLETLFVLDEQGRIRSTREPCPTPGPSFVLIRSRTTVAWAVHADLAEERAGEVIALARQESPLSDWRQSPEHADAYERIIGGQPDGGPAYAFPDGFTSLETLPLIQDDVLLHKHFTGWTAGEIDAGAGPMTGVFVDGDPVSVCFCARRSNVAAEGGVETALPFRGHGFATRAVSAWAVAVRSTSRLPLYSTSWSNAGSQRVAAKLGLILYATTFSITRPSVDDRR